jgi:hypothetical protein
MPDFELDEESVSRAAELSSRLMNDLRMVSKEGPPSQMRRELFSMRRYAEQAEGVPIADVVENVGQMATEFAIARRWDNEILCLRLDEGELAPVSMSESFGGPLWPYFASEDWLEFWERYFHLPPRRFWRDIRRRSAQQEEQLIVANVDEVEGGVERSLKSFLSYRFAGMKKWAEWIQGIGNQLFDGSPGSPRGSGPGRSITPPRQQSAPLVVFRCRSPASHLDCGFTWRQPIG